VQKPGPKGLFVKKTAPNDAKDAIPSTPGAALPKAWRWVKVGEVVAEAVPGFACGERDPDGVIQLRMNNVDTRGNVLWDEFIRVPCDIKKRERYRLRPGDVLFNNTNSTELVGKTALFTGHGEPVVYSNHFTRLRPIPDRLIPEILAFWLLSQWQAGTFVNLCNRWIGQSAVKNEKIFSLGMPLPPLVEQERIAAILKEQLAAVDKARAAAEAELETINALPAAILRRAFSGEL